MTHDKVRQDFEAIAQFKHMDFTLDKDAWGREKYKHSHIQALFDGYQAGRAAVRSKILAFQQHQAAIEREKQEALRREQEIEEANRRAAMATEADILEATGESKPQAAQQDTPQQVIAPAPVSVTPARVRSDSGALATVKKITRYRVTDIAALAAAHPACVVVNNTAVMALVNSGVNPIAGIEIYTEDQLQIR